MAYLERNAEGYLGKLVSEAGERIYLRRAFDVMDWAIEAYSGTQGCCCGCQGNYYNRVTGVIHDHRKDDSVTDMARATKQFNRIARKVMAGLNGDEPTDNIYAWKDGVSVDFGNRMYNLYRN